MKKFIKKIVPEFLIDWYHLVLAFTGAFWFGFPSRKMTVVGVTGTHGKSTTVELTSRILRETGHKVGSLSSISFRINGKEWENKFKMTMPGRFVIQKFMRQAVKEDCQYFILEVTSEGIKQHRHRFIKFDAAVFTNLSPEHIEAHGGFENYRNEKLRMFKITKNIHIINADDQNAGYFLEIPAKRKILFGENFSFQNDKESKKIIMSDVLEREDGLKFKVQGIDFQVGLMGKFNANNALAAVAICDSLGVSIEKCSDILSEINGLPGRMEKVISRPFEVFVDYAFTPAALEAVYQTLRPQNANFICVLGAAGGGRDKWKRPELGKIAEKYCDRIIVTNEDPYDEDPMEIINQVAAGTGGKAEKILDRREAVKKALQYALHGDRIVITGKGCEPWICVANGKKIPWDDRRVAKEEFERIRL